MSTMVHFIDVGQGNMVLVQCADGTNFMVDCNITEDNTDRVLRYVRSQLGRAGRLAAFICTHRDADHMRNVRTLNGHFPISQIWDSGYPGTTTDSDEYKDYMALRRQLGHQIKEKRTYRDYGRTRLNYLSAKDSRLPGNANEQGIVIKVEHRRSTGGTIQSSAMLTGDGSCITWRDGIIKDYSTGDLSCDILMAGHHGSLDFFDDPNSRYYYTDHVEAMSPAMTIISVGKNSYGHPDPKALDRYRRYSRGAANGDKIWRTDNEHTMKLVLQDGGGWTIYRNQ